MDVFVVQEHNSPDGKYGEYQVEERGAYSTMELAEKAVSTLISQDILSGERESVDEKFPTTWYEIYLLVLDNEPTQDPERKM